jgi:ribonuclease HII
MASPAARPKSSAGPFPTLQWERSLFATGVRILAAVDEVGRGAIAGPACVGVAVVGEQVQSAPSGLQDSKLLSPAKRAKLAPELWQWPGAAAVGYAQAQEIDRAGISGALQLAAFRAFAQVLARFPQLVPELILLDGSHDWLTPKYPNPSPAGMKPLFAFGSADAAFPPVLTRVKADQSCSTVAAAGVIAKVARDATLVELAAVYPGYGWERNKGYGTSAHWAALDRLGITPEHRSSWNFGRNYPQAQKSASCPQAD